MNMRGASVVVGHPAIASPQNPLFAARASIV